ncbi:serine hydrolase [Chitinibacter fontanus]|uniref:Serine hydrolase n=1 Tax=Chitinibacter fontanus TaxID=1737446 RepID=A0A7D5ZGH2_9NEIS|nr:serine hydrolase [Chitinibacter fontanus]QLI81387.1 serine hydrolase [Chitinibacter fontanus]
MTAKEPLPMKPFRIASAFALLCAHTSFAASLDHVSPESEGLSSAKLANMMKYLQTPGTNVDSVIVARNGQIVLEAYAAPNRSDIVHQVNSATKSVVSALLGIAIGEGKIKLNNTVADILPQYADLPNANILTVEKLASMSTGVEWKSEYFGSALNDWNKVRQADDWIKAYLSYPINPDKVGQFTYNSAESDLLGALISAATGMPLADYAELKLFKPLAIQNTRWVQNKDGQYGGGRGLYILPHDMLKFGELFRQQGKWQGQQIIPQQWITYSTQPRVATVGKFSNIPAYGAQWWVGKGWYAALGWGGQTIAVFPKENITMVMTAKNSLSEMDAIGLDQLHQRFLQSDSSAASDPAATQQLAAQISQFEKGVAASTLHSPLEKTLHNKSIRFNDFWLSKLKFSLDKEQMTIEFRPKDTPQFTEKIPTGFAGEWKYSTFQYPINDEWRKSAPDSLVASRMQWLDKTTLLIESFPPEEFVHYSLKLKFKGQKVFVEDSPWGTVAEGILE